MVGEHVRGLHSAVSMDMREPPTVESPPTASGTDSGAATAPEPSASKDCRPVASRP